MMPGDVLNGLRVLAVEQYGAGPFATQHLADLGAEVIKIEHPHNGGDMSRSIGPYFDERLPDTAQSLFFQSVNRNKKSLTLDLSRPEGLEIFGRLVATADAVASNMRGDVVDKLDINYGGLRAYNPAIVCAHLTGYGRTGPRAKWPGYDYLMQAEAGYFDLTGDPESAPSRMGLSIIDFMTGATLSLALLAGVVNARRTGQGRDLDVSLFGVALHNLNYIAHWNLNCGVETSRLARSAHPVLTPCQTYRTGDGWIYLMCNKEKFWPILCAHVGRSELASDPRFATFADRLNNRTLVTELLDEALSARTTAAWLMLFAGSIPAAPILSVAKALENDFAREHGVFEPIDMGDGEKPLVMMSNPIRSGPASTDPSPGPALGADTDTLMNEIGVDTNRIARLRAEGIL
ncbi:CaiB/BaiF CoA transferase family protein [Mesorhizobium sp. ArgA1]